MAEIPKWSSRSDPAAEPSERTKARAPVIDTTACVALLDSLRRIEPMSREFEFKDRDFERVRKLIYAKAGISLTPAKQDMVYSRLARRLRALGIKRFHDYLDMLEHNGHSPEWEAFVNALTTNLTSFFREAHHFETLARHLKSVSERRPLRIWCCAASTGEEPYSIAMTAIETLGPSAQVQIVASDLDTNVLAHGQRGFYGTERFDHVSPERLQRFFAPAVMGDNTGYQAKRELQRLISFRRINLLEPNWPVQGPFDAIFCRNVMIYFDKETQYRILERFVPLLREEGLLFAGHSENFIHAARLFRSLGRTVYVRADARA